MHNKNTRITMLSHSGEVWKAYGYKRWTHGRHPGTGPGPIGQQPAGERLIGRGPTGPDTYASYLRQ
ncbi:hypothetical protein [Frankia sp. CiP3]|uniref:hypothetical protein n=1 Tax=Frankia sp. CiP3 TaxID=2880971 RepID=UPI001EF40BCC|nr:hypothetical protein [Frankia sp. CiP3]